MAALTCTSALDNDFILTGRELLSYDEVARRISEAVGRTISHRRLSAEKLATRYQSLGLSSAHGQMLAAMDSAIASGAEDRVTSCIEDLTGRPPTPFDAFVAASAPKWSS